ncbi:hypothetical protein J6590_005334, partial [Homalodisca vitripennis]
ALLEYTASTRSHRKYGNVGTIYHKGLSRLRRLSPSSCGKLSVRPYCDINLPSASSCAVNCLEGKLTQGKLIKSPPVSQITLFPMFNYKIPSLRRQI